MQKELLTYDIVFVSIFPLTIGELEDDVMQSLSISTY
jgi:hypothetical protein